MSKSIAQINREIDSSYDTAIEKGWLPSKPLKGRLSKKLVGMMAKVGWCDASPAWGFIVDVSQWGEAEVFIPSMNAVEHVARDQIFEVCFIDWRNILPTIGG